MEQNEAREKIEGIVSRLRESGVPVVYETDMANGKLSLNVTPGSIHQDDVTQGTLVPVTKRDLHTHNLPAARAFLVAMEYAGLVEVAA